MSTMVFDAADYASLTLLEMVQAMARDVGIPAPEQVIGAGDANAAKALDIANRTGAELQRRVDWGGLVTPMTISGTGAPIWHTFPSDYSRIAKGGVVVAGGSPVRGLSRAEWDTLTLTEGTPRYFLAEDAKIRFFPYLASGATVSVSFISNLWGTAGAAFEADSDTTVFPSELFIKCMIVRWRRQMGMDYADHEAEYEAALRDFAGFDDRARY